MDEEDSVEDSSDDELDLIRWRQRRQRKQRRIVGKNAQHDRDVFGATNSSTRAKEGGDEIHDSKANGSDGRQDSSSPAAFGRTSGSAAVKVQNQYNERLLDDRGTDTEEQDDSELEQGLSDDEEATVHAHVVAEETLPGSPYEPGSRPTDAEKPNDRQSRPPTATRGRPSRRAAKKVQYNEVLSDDYETEIEKEDCDSEFERGLSDEEEAFVEAHAIAEEALPIQRKRKERAATTGATQRRPHPGFSPTYSSSYVGVVLVKNALKKKWYVTKTGESFSDELEAAKNYDEYARSLGKPVNFPGTGERKAVKKAPQRKLDKSRPMEQRSSKYLGVSWTRARYVWKATVRHNGKNVHLGFYEDEQEAARAFDSYVRPLGRPVNFPRDGEESALEKKKQQQAKKSQYIGVVTDNNKHRRKNFKARAWDKKTKKFKYLGYFYTAVEAARKYDEHASRIPGKPLNFPKGFQE